VRPAFGQAVTRTNALEAPVISCWVDRASKGQRGLTHDTKAHRS
jgi:hypothetical protein